MLELSLERCTGIGQVTKVRGYPWQQKQKGQSHEWSMKQHMCGVLQGVHCLHKSIPYLLSAYNLTLECSIYTMTLEYSIHTMTL